METKKLHSKYFSNDTNKLLNLEFNKIKDKYRKNNKITKYDIEFIYWVGNLFSNKELQEFSIKEKFNKNKPISKKLETFFAKCEIPYFVGLSIFNKNNKKDNKKRKLEN